MTEMIHFSDEAISTEYSALMSKVVTDGNGPRQVPDQRARRGQAQVADRRVPRVLRGPGRPAHRADDARHRRHGRGAARARRRVPAHARTPTTTRSRRAFGEIERVAGRPARLGHPGRPRRRGLPAADLHQADRRPPDDLLRDHRAPRRARLRRGQLQGAVRGDRARAGPPGQPVGDALRIEPRRGPRQAPRPGARDGRARSCWSRRSWATRASRGNESILYHLHSPCRLDEVGGFTPIAREEWVPDAHVHRLADINRVARGRRPGLRPPAADVQQRHRGVGLQADRGARRLLPQRRGRRGHLRPPRRRRAAHDLRAACRSASSDYVVIPRGTTHTLRARRRATSSSGCASTRRARSRRPTATATATASCSSTRRSRSATSTAPVELETHRRDGEFTLDRARARRLPALRARPPPVRRRRLGRLRLPVHVQRRRLRAARRPLPPAAAGPPDLPGPELRDLHVRAADARLGSARRCRCPTTTRTSSPRRSCSTPRATTPRARASTSAA